MSYKDNPSYIETKSKTQKATADRVLNVLTNSGFTAVCAGGAPRDWYLGRIAKDLDFFVDKKSKTNTEFEVEDFFKILGKGVAIFNTELEQSGMYESNPRLKQVYEFEFEDQTCQLIITQPSIADYEEDRILNPAWDIHKTFPVNVSKATYRADSNFKYGLEYTDDFKYGHQFKILDFNEEFLYNDFYKRKIRRKFKDYAIVLRKVKPEIVDGLDYLQDCTNIRLKGRKLKQKG